MMNKIEKPNKKVKLTLTEHWQNKLLSLLSVHCNIQESFPEDHVIYMSEKTWTELWFGIQNSQIKITSQQLKAEYVDFKKEPQITVVRSFGNYQKLNKSESQNGDT